VRRVVHSLGAGAVWLALGIGAAGCGGDDHGNPIPAATASALQTELNGVEDRLNQGSAGACKDILEGPRGPNKPRVQDLIDSMPSGVDSDVKSALQDSFDNLWDRVQQDCDDKQSSEQPTKTTPTDTAPETTPTETQTDTTPTETETTTTPTSPEEAPLPNDGNGNGTGNGDGNGGGGGAGTGNGNGTDNGTGAGGGVGPGDEAN
jgi:hypothetical protein